MAGRPTITAAIDLTPEVLNALKQAGPNDRGNYSLDMAVWPNEKRTSEKSPSHTGSVKLKGSKGDGPKGFASVWTNMATTASNDLF